MATLRPQIPASAFPEEPTSVELSPSKADLNRNGAVVGSEGTRKAANSVITLHRDHSKQEFDDEDIDDLALAEVIKDADFADIDSIPLADSERTQGHLSGPGKARKSVASLQQAKVQTCDPVRLKNGRWACNHKCKNKRTCKHDCCRNGMDRPPRLAKEQESGSTGTQPISSMRGFTKQAKPRAKVQEANGKANSHGMSRREAGHPSRSPSTQYDDGSSLFNYEEFDDAEPSQEGFAPLRPLQRSDPNNQSMFLTDSSSPEKQQRIGTLDLTGKANVTSAKRLHDLANQEPLTKSVFQTKRQRLLEEVNPEAHVDSLRELEGRTPSFVRSEPHAFEVNDQNFGNNDDFADLSDKRQNRFDDSDIEDFMLEQYPIRDDILPHAYNAGDSNPILSDVKTTRACEAHISLPFDPPHRVFEAEEEDLGLVGPYTSKIMPEQSENPDVSATQNKTVGESEVCGSEAWLMKEFGEYVNFV